MVAGDECIHGENVVDNGHRCRRCLSYESLAALVLAVVVVVLLDAMTSADDVTLVTGSASTVAASSSVSGTSYSLPVTWDSRLVLLFLLALLLLLLNHQVWRAASRALAAPSLHCPLRPLRYVVAVRRFTFCRNPSPLLTCSVLFCLFPGLFPNFLLLSRSILSVRLSVWLSMCTALYTKHTC